MSVSVCFYVYYNDTYTQRVYCFHHVHLSFCGQNRIFSNTHSPFDIYTFYQATSDGVSLVTVFFFFFQNKKKMKFWQIL